MTILGIGVGKFEMSLNRTDFHPGDQVEGMATLRLNEQTKSRGVFAEFWAERTERRGKHSHTVILYRREENLDREGEYPAGVPKTYSFKFEVPCGVLNESRLNNDIVGGVMGWFRDMGNNSIRWHVRIKLDLPMAFDVSAKQQLRVTLAPQSMPGVQMQ